MSYTIISSKTVCGKIKGDTLTNEELQDAGVSAETLIAGNHIKASNTAPQIPSIKAAIEGDRTLGGTCQTLRVIGAESGTYDSQSNTFLSYRYRLTIWG